MHRLDDGPARQEILNNMYGVWQSFPDTRKWQIGGDCWDRIQEEYARCNCEADTFKNPDVQES